MNSAILLLQVVLFTLMQVQSVEKCTERYTLIPGPTPCNGRDGIQGVAGRTGDKGDRGNIGPAGPKGDKGNIGLAGSKGNIGATGLKGDQGNIGATGSKGDKGNIGVSGTKGDGQGCFGMDRDALLLVTNVVNPYRWFHREIPATSDNIEVRWCTDYVLSDEDVLTDQLEIWVM